MESIKLGPFSFITSIDNLKDDRIKKDIQESINKNTKMDKIVYTVNLLEITKSYKPNEFNYNFEIIVRAKTVSEEYQNIQQEDYKESEIKNNMETEKMKNESKIFTEQQEIMLNIMKRPLLIKISRKSETRITELKDYSKDVNFYIYDKIRELPKIAFENKVARFGGKSHLTDPSSLRENEELKNDTYDIFEYIDKNELSVFKCLIDRDLLKPNIPLIIVAHQASIKDIIFKDHLTSPNTKIGNCAIIKLEFSIKLDNTIEGESEVIFKGYQDKEGETYYATGTTTLIKDKDIFFKENFNSLCDNSPQKYIIYIIRHANGLHNLPLKFKSGIIKRLGEKKGNNDSPLSMMGILQALECGKKLYDDITAESISIPNEKKRIYVTSTLNRSQLTGLLIHYAMYIRIDTETIDYQAKFIELMKKLIPDTDYFENELLVIKDRGELIEACKKQFTSLNDYTTMLNDKLFSVMCYFLHCAIARMLYLQSFRINDSNRTSNEWTNKIFKKLVNSTGPGLLATTSSTASSPPPPLSPSPSPLSPSPSPLSPSPSPSLSPQTDDSDSNSEFG